MGAAQVEYLGFLITAEGSRPLPEKVQAIFNYKLPETIHDANTLNELNKLIPENGQKLALDAKILYIREGVTQKNMIDTKCVTLNGWKNLIPEITAEIVGRATMDLRVWCQNVIPGDTCRTIPGNLGYILRNGGRSSLRHLNMDLTFITWVEKGMANRKPWQGVSKTKFWEPLVWIIPSNRMYVVSMQVLLGTILLAEGISAQFVNEIFLSIFNCVAILEDQEMCDEFMNCDKKLAQPVCGHN
ncbi:hypothetical protein TNCV_786981 [Trichonephila clavipes]|nr:hypothetical protein TNCV_786981 [Trichonephila clavipes]